MVTFFIEQVWMVGVFVCHMHQEVVPLGKDKVSKACFGGCGTSVEMLVNPFHPGLDYLVAFLLACNKRLLCKGSGHTPNVEKTGCVSAVLSYPFHYSSMAIRYRTTNG